MAYLRILYFVERIPTDRLTGMGVWPITTDRPPDSAAKTANRRTLACHFQSCSYGPAIVLDRVEILTLLTKCSSVTCWAFAHSSSRTCALPSVAAVKFFADFRQTKKGGLESQLILIFKIDRQNTWRWIALTLTTLTEIFVLRVAR